MNAPIITDLAGNDQCALYVNAKVESNNTNRGYLSLDVRHWADANNARLLTPEGMLASFNPSAGG